MSLRASPYAWSSSISNVGLLMTRSRRASQATIYHTSLTTISSSNELQLERYHRYRTHLHAYDIHTSVTVNGLYIQSLSHLQDAYKMTVLPTVPPKHFHRIGHQHTFNRTYFHLTYCGNVTATSTLANCKLMCTWLDAFIRNALCTKCFRFVEWGHQRLVTIAPHLRPSKRHGNRNSRIIHWPRHWGYVNQHGVSHALREDDWCIQYYTDSSMTDLIAGVVWANDTVDMQGDK